MAEDIDKAQIVQEVLGEVKNASTSVEDLNTVSSLSGVKSLPAIKGEELVNVPISLLSKAAEDAAKQAAASAKKAEESVVGLEEKTLAADEAARLAKEAAAKAENAAYVVENSTVAALNGATVRFSGIVDRVVLQLQSSVQAGGKVVYVKSSGLFAYNVDGKYYANWNVAGVPNPDMFMYAGNTKIHCDKLYVFGNSLYTATSGKLVLFSHRHEVLSEDAYEALAEKDDTTIYMTYEEE